jgi:hypothetical protein
MAASTGSGKDGPLSPRSARVQMEEALGKPDITEEEATPLVLDDLGKMVRSKSGRWLGRCFVVLFFISTRSMVLCDLHGAIQRGWHFDLWE